MHGLSDWRPTLAISCTLAVILIAITVWNIRKSSSPSAVVKKKKKNAETEEPQKEPEQLGINNVQNSVSQIDEKSESEASESDVSDGGLIPELPQPRWIKVGQVEELYIYPLKSGRGKDVSECEFTEFGMSLKVPGRYTLRDRMFLVYNDETKRFQTGRKYPTLILVSLSAVDEFKVKLEAVGMPSMVFNVPEYKEGSSEAVECTMWWGEPIKCIDCGTEAAEWISRFLTGTSFDDLRLGCALTDRREIMKGPWERYTKVYKTLRSEDTGLFSDLASYMLLTSQSVEKLNEKLERPVPALQFRPNIVVNSKGAFAEDDWEWIRIGESAVIRNVKCCARCKMVKVDPESGVADKDEPLKTLQSFREQTDPERVALDEKSPTMGIYCGLYVTGKVNVGDTVFVHVPDKSMEISYQQITPTDES